MLNGIMNFGLIFRARSNLERIVLKDIAALKGLDLTSKAAAATLGVFQQRVAAVALGLGAIGLTGAYLGGIAAAAKLEDQLQRTRIVTGDTFKSNFELATSLIDVSNTSSVAAVNLGKMAEIAGTAGLAAQFGARDFIQFTDTASKLSKVSGLAATETSRLLATAARQLKIGTAEELHRYASALQAVGKNSISGTAEVARFMAGLAALQKQSQFTTPQLLAIAGAAKSFGNLTVEVLETNLPKFLREAATHADLVGKNLGMTGDEVEKLISADPFAFFVKFLEFMKEFEGDLTATAKALDAMGIKSQRIFRIIAGGSGQIEHMTDLLKIAQADFGGLADTLNQDFAMAMDTFLGQLGRLQAILSNLSILIGTPFLKGFTMVLRVLNSIGLVIVEILKTPVGQFAAEVIGWASAFIAVASVIQVVVFLLTKLGSLALVKFVMTSLPAVLGMAAASFWEVAAVVGILIVGVKFLANLLSSALGPGIKRMAEFMGDVVSGVKDFLDDGKMSISVWNDLEKKGVLPVVLGILKVINLGKAFFDGFMEAFEGFFDGVSQPFLDLVNDTIELLQALGLIQQELGPMTSTAKALGFAVGALIRGIGMVLNAIIIVPLRIINDGLRALMQLLTGVTNGVRYVAGLLGFGVGGTSGANLRDVNAFPTALPIRAPTKPQDVGRDVVGAANIARRRITEGAEVPSNGILADLTVYSSVNIEEREVGRAVGNHRRRLETNRTGMAPRVRQAAGFRGMNDYYDDFAD